MCNKLTVDFCDPATMGKSAKTSTNTALFPRVSLITKNKNMK